MTRAAAYTLRMAPYRDNDRWGRLVSTHHVGITSWVLGVAVGVLGAVFCGYYAQQGVAPSKMWLGAIVMTGLTMWFIVEIVRLRGIVLQCFERGLAFTSNREHHEVAWDEIALVDALYVPGVLGKGIEDEGNLVAVNVSFVGGMMKLPKELHELTAIVDALKTKTKARWVQTKIANLLQR